MVTLAMSHKMSRVIQKGKGDLGYDVMNSFT